MKPELTVLSPEDAPKPAQDAKQSPVLYSGSSLCHEGSRQFLSQKNRLLSFIGFCLLNAGFDFFGLLLDNVKLTSDENSEELIQAIIAAVENLIATGVLDPGKGQDACPRCSTRARR